MNKKIVLFVFILSLIIITTLIIIMNGKYIPSSPKPSNSPETHGKFRSEGTAKAPRELRGYHVVNLIYATDRNKIINSTFEVEYNSKRGDKISYGKVSVSIPFTHRIGAIESPSFWKFEFSSTPEKHIQILKLKDINYREYLKTLKTSLQNTYKNHALIFIHGYNVTFIDAARRTAQITYDLEFKGISMFYSWPSVGKESAYTIDETNIKWSEKNIEKFLADIALKSGVDNIYIIAHSMGNRGLTRSLSKLLIKSPNLSSKFKEVILAAPDIDADIFKNNILPEMTKFDIPITLYTAADDKALMFSKKIHGYPRAGEKIIIHPGIETVDATGIDTSFFRHSYFSENRSVLSDISDITNKSERANERFFIKKSDNKKYWIFKK